MAGRKIASTVGKQIGKIISPEDAAKRLKGRKRKLQKARSTGGGNVKTTSGKKPTSKPISDEKGRGRGKFQKGSAPAPQNQNVSRRKEEKAMGEVESGKAGKVETRGEKMTRAQVAGGSESSREAGKEKARLQAIIRDKSKTKKQRDAAQAKLDKMRAGDEAATKTARKKATQTRRKNVQAEREKNPSGVRDKVAHFMQTGEIIEGFEPTPAQIKQANVNAARRKEMSRSRKNRKKFAEKKYGGKVKRSEGGKTLKAVDAKKNPGLAKLSRPVRNKMSFAKKGKKVSESMMEDYTSVPKELSAQAQSKKKKKMGGGKVYKKMHGGKVIKNNMSGQDLVNACYD